MAGKEINIEVVQTRGLSLMAKADSNHWVTMDGPEEMGGSAAATRPIELFLMGLGGCTGMDVISILNKKRVPYTDFKIDIHAVRADKHPKVFESIKLIFKVYGIGIKEKDVKRAIELSEDKYCAASAMLKQVVDIETSFEIIEK